MRPLKTTTLLLLLALIQNQSTWSFNSHFKKIDNRQGLSSDQVLDLCQDMEGFIWIATDDGLNCYTATEVINYRPRRKDKNTISSSRIQALTVSKDNKLWIAYQDGTIETLDRQSNTIKAIPFTSSKSAKIKINNLLCDSQGNIWLSTNKGVSEYSTIEQTFKHYKIQNKDNYVNVVYETPSGTLLCGVWGGSLFRLNKQPQKFEHLPLNDNRRNINIKSILEDHTGNLWIETWGNGLYKAQKNKQGGYTSTHLNILNDHYPEHNSYQIVYDIIQDKDGAYGWVPMLV